MSAATAAGAAIDSTRTELGPRLVDRWEMWQPSIATMESPTAYPMFEALAAKVRDQGNERTYTRAT